MSRRSKRGSGGNKPRRDTAGEERAIKAITARVRPRGLPVVALSLGARQERGDYREMDWSSKYVPQKY